MPENVNACVCAFNPNVMFPCGGLDVPIAFAIGFCEFARNFLTIGRLLWRFGDSLSRCWGRFPASSVSPPPGRLDVTWMFRFPVLLSAIHSDHCIWRV